MINISIAIIHMITIESKVKKLIEVRNLNKQFKMNIKYPGFKGAIKSFFSNKYTIKTAVDNISFNISDGEVVGYIGANGAGKSTTIKMMTGILTPTSGEIIVNGIIPYKDRQKNAKDIGVVFGQKTQLWWDLPLSETFTLLKDIYEVEDKEFKERMKFLNEVLELNDFILTPVRALSLGQRMRGDLAAALIHNPKVVYLDEPTIGLDVVVKDNVRKAIKKLNEKFGTTVILTTHDLSDIEELCNRIIIIDKGKMLYDGNLENLKEKYGYMSTVEIQTKRRIQLKEVEFIKNLDKENIDITIKANNLAIKFNKNNTSTTEITKSLMNKLDIVDFSINETKIEDIIMLAVTYYLWKGVYGSSPESIIKGFSLDEMIIYVLVSFITMLMTSVNIIYDISREVKDGSIAINLVRPVSYEKRMLFQSLGNIFYNFVTIFLISFTLVNILFYHYKGTLSLLNVLLYIISTMLGALINFYFSYSFGLLSFKITNMWGLSQIMNAIVNLISGALIPITFFPSIFQNIINLFPFSSLIYTPTMIYLGKLTGIELVKALSLQIIWIIILAALAKFMWGTLVKKLTILGG